MIAADGSLAPPGDCMVSPFPRLYKVLEADPSQAEQTCYKAARVSPGRPHHPMHFAQGRTDGWSVLSLGCGSPGKGDAGWSSPVARQAHNLKVVGSNPTPATTYKVSFVHSLFLLQQGCQISYNLKLHRVRRRCDPYSTPPR